MISLNTYSSLEKIFPQLEPGLASSKGSMLRNERYHFQVNAYNDGEATMGYSLRIESDIKKFVTVRTVAYVPGFVNVFEDSDDYVIFPKGQDVRLYPDVLLPTDDLPFALRGWQNNVFWVTVHAPEGLPVGEHAIKICLTCEDKKTECSFTLDVKDAMLPESDLIYTNWMHYDCISEAHGVEPFGDEFYKYFDSYLRTAVSHGMNMLYTPVFTPALDTYIGGERMTVQLVDIKRHGETYEFDFSRLDRFIDFAKERGIRYFEISHLTTQWGAKACPKIMASTEEGYKPIFGWDTPSDGAEYKSFLTQFLPKLDAFLKKKGVDKYTYFHISDEPQSEHYEHYTRVHNFIRPLISDYKLMDATSDEKNSLGLDCPVMATVHMTNPKTLPTDCWVYYCCAPRNRYMSNRFFNMPSQRNRILGFQLYDTDRKGFLHWGFNFYNSQYSYRTVNPYLEADANGSFPSGDSYVVYPSKDGALTSLRLEVFYDALQDRMALIALERKIGREATLKLLHDEGVSGFSDYPRDAEWHMAFRERINDLISEK